MKKQRFFKIIKSTIFSIAVTVVFLSAIYGLVKDNIHTVIPNQVYRSAQLSPREFSKLIFKDKIKSIINLRGENEDNGWYQNEIAVSKKLGVNHYDLSLIAYKLPTIDKFRMLVHLLETVPRPILIHCAGGADRTGLASAVALILQNKPLIEAQKQISYFYFAISSKSVGRLALPLYKNWLQKNHLQSNRENFLKWVNQISVKNSWTSM